MPTNKVKIRSIHPRIVTSASLAPPNGIIEFDIKEGDKFVNVIDESVARALVAISRKGEFEIVDPLPLLKAVEEPASPAFVPQQPAPEGGSAPAPASPSLTSKVKTKAADPVVVGPTVGAAGKAGG